VENFDISVGGRVLFQKADLIITFGRRYGIVGPNGMGKTTLLKHVADYKLPGIPEDLDILYCEQGKMRSSSLTLITTPLEIEAVPTSAIEVVLSSDKTRIDLIQKQAEATARLEDGDIDAAEELQEIGDQLRNIGADAAESKARRILCREIRA
jgi:ATPase subunit of ABC transporter with duplicated ATPase domains